MWNLGLRCPNTRLSLSIISDRGRTTALTLEQSRRVTCPHTRLKPSRITTSQAKTHRQTSMADKEVDRG